MVIYRSETLLAAAVPARLVVVTVHVALHPAARKPPPMSTSGRLLRD